MPAIYRLRSWLVRKEIRRAAAGLAVLLPAGIFIRHARAITAAIGAALTATIPQNIMVRFQTISLRDVNVVSRVRFDLDALKIIRANWLLGTGGGGWAALYQSVQEKEYIAKLVHNHYLQVWVEAGILGFAAFVLLVLTAGALYLHTRCRTKHQRDQSSAAVLFGAYAALAVHAAIDFDLSYSGMALIFWGLTGLAAASYRPVPRDSAAPAGGRRKRLRIAAAMLTLALLTLPPNAVGLAAAAYANRGTAHKEALAPLPAITCFETAVRLDRGNAAYHAALADLYNWMTATGQKTIEIEAWRDRAYRAATAAVNANPKTPYYRQLLAETCFAAGRWIEGYAQARELVALQPLRAANYELLLRGSVEAAVQHLNDGRTAEAKELLAMAADRGRIADAEPTAANLYYEGKANLLLGNYARAAEALNKARRGPPEIRMASDRLLYIVNELTGREEKNAAYKGILWMGTVKLTPDYRLVHRVRESGGLDS